MKNILRNSFKKITLPIVLGFAWLGMESISLAQGTVFSENVGTPTGTTIIATYAAGTAPATFQNKGTLTYGLGEQVLGADCRASSASSGYTGASGGGNVFFTSTSGIYGFSIESINASAFTSLQLSYAYRKETATTLATMSVDYWNGSSWVTVANSAANLFNETTTSAIAWYPAKTLSLPAGAQINGLKIRFVKSGTASIRLDDIKLTGSASLSPSVTPSVSTLSAFSTTAGTASAAQTFTVTGANLSADVTVTAPTGFEVATDGATFAGSKILTQSAGAVSGTISVRIAASTAQGTLASANVTLVSGPTSANVAVSGTVTAVGAASVSLTGGTLTAFNTVLGTASAAQSFTVSGSNLTSAITLTAPAGFEVSTDAASYASSKTLTQVSGTVAATTISVRIAASTAAGTLASANVTVAATGVTTANVAVSGTVTTPALTLVLDPTTVAENAGASASTGTVGIPASLSSNLVVNLVSTNTAAATVPVSVTIPTGQTSATFPIAAVANSSSYGPATTAIEASNSNYTTASATLTVTNVDVPPAALATKGWINELHYDNSTSNDPGEFVEIVLAPGASDNVSVVFYNGSISAAAVPYSVVVTLPNGTSSASLLEVPFASMTTGTTSNGYRILSIPMAASTSGGYFQNGAPDGVALIIDGVVEEFLSYEGVMTASTGAAAGYTSTDCKVSETQATPNTSLQRVGPGSRAADFAWIAGATSSKGSANTSQNLGATAVQGTGTLAIANGTASSAFVTQNIFPKATSGQTVSLTLTGTLSSGTIGAMSVVVPAAFTGLSLGNVTVSGAGAGTGLKTLSGSTLTITGLVVDQLNPVTINIGGLTTPETAGDLTKDGNYPFTVQTGVEGNLQAMLLPAIAVVTIPIANLGDVDASGVSLDEGKTVAVQGVCTEENFNSTSSTSAYLQSGQPNGVLKAGINIYSGQRNLFVRGDEYVITGSVLNYSGLTEIKVEASSQVVRLGTATTVPTPVTLTIAQLTAAHEAYEGSLVRVAGLSKVSGTWALTVAAGVTSGSNIILANGGVNLTARLNVGSTALTEPIYPTAITGIYGQFVATSPYTGGGQIQPRDQADIEDAPGLRLAFAEAYLFESTNPVGGGAIVSGALTVSRTGADTSAALVVALSASPTGLLQFPASVTIPAGQESAIVTVEAIDNSAFDAAGFTNVTLTGSALGSGLSNGSATIIVLEDEASAPADTIKPVITLLGANPQLVANGAVYADLKATVTDNVDASREITGTGTVNTALAGDYTITYNASDAAGNAAIQVTRTVRVAAPLGTTYSSWLNGASASDAALLDYVFGATAPGALAASLKPTVAVTGGYLVLTYYVREGTVGLTVTPKTSADLALGAGGWSTAEDVAEVATTTVNGVSVRKHTARVLVSGLKKFLRIQAVQQ
jgi:Domain of unknown function (DUF5011)